MTWLTVKGSTFMLMVLSMRANGSRMSSMVKVRTVGLMVQDIAENMREVESMVRVSWFSQRAVTMKVNSSITRSQAMEVTIGLMAKNTKVSGKPIKWMVAVV